MKSSILKISLLVMIILLVGIQVLFTGCSGVIRDSNDIENTSMPLNSALLKELKKTNDVPSKCPLATVTVLNTDFDENSISVHIRITSHDPRIALSFANSVVDDITRFLLKFEIWSNYKIIFDEKGAVSFEDSEKTSSPKGYYFDSEATGYGAELKEIFGVE